MMRVTLRSAAGEERVEDLLGPTEWRKRDYRAAINRQRPGVVVLDMEPVRRILQAGGAAAQLRQHRPVSRRPRREGEPRVSTTCPSCQAPRMRVVESVVRADGTRRRRLQCRECRYRLTQADPRPGDAPSCHRCEFYRSELSPPCWWRFPDVLEEGPKVAADCTQWVEAAR